MDIVHKNIETAFDDINSEGQHLVSLIFDNRARAKTAIKKLFKRGYTPKDIDVLSQQELARTSYEVLGRNVESNDLIMHHLAFGLKRGAMIGTIIAIILCTIGVLTHVLTLSIFLLLYLFVGAVWGATLAFFLQLTLPFNSKHYYKRKFSKGNVLVRFWTKYDEKRTYFKQMHWTLCKLQ